MNQEIESKALQEVRKLSHITSTADKKTGSLCRFAIWGFLLFSPTNTNKKAAVMSADVKYIQYPAAGGTHSQLLCRISL